MIQPLARTALVLIFGKPHRTVAVAGVSIGSFAWKPGEQSLADEPQYFGLNLM